LSIAIAAAAVLGAGALVPGALAKENAAFWINPSATSPDTPSASAEASPEASGRAGEMTSMLNIDFQGEFLGWAMRDGQGGLVGENMTETSSTESMIKAWLVADFLRQNPNPDEGDLKHAREAIRWSDDDSAQVLYEANGGDASIERMIRMCGLADTTVYEGWWSRTQMSPRDAVALGVCLSDGTAAGAYRTPWLINEMKNVQGTADASDQWDKRGGGHWGIVDGVPAAQAGEVAIKNGWTSIGSDGNWHLSCLAFTDDWTLSVMMRYPSELGLEYGANVCQSVASQLLSVPGEARP
jgi:hypothetical protein